MKISTHLTTKLGFIWVRALTVLVLFTCTLGFSQNPIYQVKRLNNGNPIIEPSMFNNPDDGENINGPSLIRIPDWIPTNRRANPSAQYYLYFAHHGGDYIRMAWAQDIEGPYTLYNDFTNRGDRGVLDNNREDIFLDNHIRIEENHLASPDVIVDNENQRIIMYFHSGSSFFVNGDEQNRQVSWVSTSPYGLEFYDGIESVQFGTSYFRLFNYDNELYALDNGARVNRALDADNPWDAPNGHDFRDQLWDRNPNHVFQDNISLPSSELRVRHTGVRVVGNQLHAFYSRRGEFQERIQLSTVDLRGDWRDWDPSPPIELITPNPGWEGGHRQLRNSETSAGINVNQLRDPDFFEDEDGQMYIVYTGNGEGGLGIAKLYETPTVNNTLTAIEDSHIRENSNINFGSLNTLRTSRGSNSSDNRTIYMKFDLSRISDVSHAVVRLFASSSSEGPITVYETSNNWEENSLTANNAPALGQAITTTYLSNDDQFYDWNITDYAQENEGSIISIAFNIGPSNNANYEFGSIQGSNAGQLLLMAETSNINSILDNVNVNTDVVSDSNVVHISKRNAPDFALDGNRGGAIGQNIYLWDENDNNVNQQWIEIDRGNGYFSYQKMNTNFCIDGGNGGTNNQNVYLWTCNNNNRNQHWEKVSTGGGAFRLVKRNSPGFAINGGNNGETGQNVNLYNSSTSSQNLDWFITPIGVSAKSIETINSNKVLIYPNPVESITTIEGAGNTTLSIYDMAGKVILTKNVTSDSEELNLSKLPEGVYYTQITGIEGTSIVKLVKR